MRKTSLFFIALLLSSCGLFEPKTKTKIVEKKVPGPTQPPPTVPVPSTCSDGSPLGSTRVERCPAGQQGNILKVCTERGWINGQNTCTQQCQGEDGEGKVNFVGDIQPILQRACVACHSQPNMGTYEVAKSKINNIIYRIKLPSSDLRAMPRPPYQISGQEIQLFEQWLSEGLLESDGCNEPGPDGSEWIQLDLNYIESAIEADLLNNLNQQGRENAAYLVMAHKYYRDITPEQFSTYMKGVQKGLNSLSLENDVAFASPVDPRQTVYRVDLRSFTFDREPFQLIDDWDRTTNADQFRFISQTQKGRVISQLTGRVQPWLHADNYLNLTFQNPDLYYDIVGNVPLIEDELYANLGINLVEEFDEFNAFLMGFNGSVIGLNKNRQLYRAFGQAPGTDWIWGTRDVDQLNLNDDRNFFQNPLIPETGGDAQNVLDGKEVLWINPNGAMGMALYNGAGGRENEGPATLVTSAGFDPFTPIISTGGPCLRCHNNGLIPVRDQILPSVQARRGAFSASDNQLIDAHYRSNAAISAAFNRDIVKYQEFLTKLDINGADPDPVNVFTDDHRRDWTLKDAASFTFFTEQQMIDCIRSSRNGEAAIGQLLPNSEGQSGTVSLLEFQNAFRNFLIVDCNIGQDPLRDQ